MDLNDKQTNTTANNDIKTNTNNINKAREAFAQRSTNTNAFASETVPNNKSNNPNSNNSSSAMGDYIKQANQLDDIVLNDSKNIEESDGNKGYVLFAIAIVVVFIVTIVFMKFLSNDFFNNADNMQASSNQQAKTQEQALNTQKLNTKIKQEQNNLLKNKLAWEAKKNNEEKLIAKKLEESNKQKLQKINMQVAEQKEPDINLDNLEIPTMLKDKYKNNINDEKNSNKDDDELKNVFEEVNMSFIKTGTISKNEPIKKSATPAKNTNKAKNKTVKKSKAISKVPKFYIQIGAFSKTAKDLLVQKIKKQTGQNRYKYFTYPITVNNVDYVKVLIGPYNTRKQVVDILPKVKKDFAQPRAYILKL